MIQKIKGYGLLFLAGILTFGSLGSFGAFIKAVGNLILALAGKLDAEKSGEAFGAIFAQTLIFIAIYYSWKYGRKWTRKNTVVPEKITDTEV